MELDRVHTQQLLKQAPSAYRTQINDLLLTALARAIERWSGEQAVTVLVEGMGERTCSRGWISAAQSGGSRPSIRCSFALTLTWA